MAHFSKNGYVSEKNFQWEKIFKIDIFVLEYVLNNYKSIPTEKKISKNFRFFGQNFFEKMAKSQKKFAMGKNFQNRYYRLEIRFESF